MILTKSEYVEFVLCPRKRGLNLYAPEEPLDVENKRALEGEKVNILARDYFGKNVCQIYDEKRPTTKPGIYAEYLLEYKNLKCYCDIVRINKDGSFDIYEVKSVTNVNEKKFLEDISFQYYVANKMNINVNSINLMYLSKEYIYDGIELKIDSLFTYKDKTLEVKNRQNIVEENIQNYFQLSKNTIPSCPFSSYCKENGGCQYVSACKKIKNLPANHSTYELYRCNNKSKLIENGLLTWEEIYKNPIYDDLSDYNKIMIDKYIKKDNTIFIRKDLLNEFFNKWQYPLYFFDFETCQETIPVYANSRPYSQIPFQYSLHIMNNEFENEETVINNHKEYLGDGINDPRENLIKRMIDDLGTTGSIIAYNKSFEQEIIEDLIKDFPQYKTELEAIKNRFVDLKDVFSYRKPYYYMYKRGDKAGQIEERYETGVVCLYHPSMENSASIKRVLPSFFPDRKDLNYKNLSQVHHGAEATDAYKELRTLKGEKREILIENMLRYCHLDTKAMVVLFMKFKELCK